MKEMILGAILGITLMVVVPDKYTWTVDNANRVTICYRPGIFTTGAGAACSTSPFQNWIPMPHGASVFLNYDLTSGP
jgi:hypothetical protein